MQKTKDQWPALRAAAGATAAILKAIGNEHRLLMLCALAEQPLAVCDLNRQVPLAQSALSQHLARLRDAGLVAAQRDGPKVRYSLADERTRRLMDLLCAEYCPSATVPGIG